MHSILSLILNIIIGNERGDNTDSVFLFVFLHQQLLPAIPTLTPTKFN